MDQLFSQQIQNPAFFIPLTLWSLAWKGLALWRSAKNNQKYWFIVILVVNTVGILEIVYLTWFCGKERFWNKIVKRIPKTSR